MTGAGAALQAGRECQSHRGAIANLPDPRDAGGALGPPSNRPRIDSGTGFFVSTDGSFLTANHVVEKCAAVQISLAGSPLHEARVKATDKENDLAFVSSDLVPTVVPALRADIVAGESVEVYGFPLPGILAQSGAYTVGNISALAGTGGDEAKLQMSAPTQAGNSGGPLLDQFGNVVGIVVGPVVYGPPPAQNGNFAVKADVAISFLKANKFEPNASASVTSLNATQLAERAKLFTAQIICRLPPRPPQRKPQQQAPNPQDKRVVLRLTQTEWQRGAGDMQFGAAAPQQIIPQNTVFETVYTSLYWDCRLRAEYYGDRNVVLCPVTFRGHVTWVNALHLDTGDGPLSCVIDRRSFGCRPANARRAP